MGVTGYEVRAYRDIERVADNLETIANTLEAIRWQMVKMAEQRRRETKENEHG